MREFLNSLHKLEFDKVKKYIQRYSLSDLGREHLEKLQPSGDKESIIYQLSLVTEMKQLLEAEDPLPLENIFDIRNSLHRSSIDNFILPPDELKKIQLVLQSSKFIHTYFSRRDKNYPLLKSIVTNIHIEKILEYNINRAIDEGGNVKDSASKELEKLRRKIIEKNDNLRKNLVTVMKSIAGKEWTQEEIITTRDGRMVIPVKVEHKNRVPGFIHSASASGATVFIEPTITLELNNDIRTLTIQEQREVERILKELTGQVREAKDRIFQNIITLGELDFIRSKSMYSIEILGVAPTIREGTGLKIIDAYHPILLQRHSRETIVPLNMVISEKDHTIVITGPNAGGKSVAMKTVGLLALLTQSGCHIPVASDTEMKIFSDIFVDMGDEQSIENDLSSFSSHLNNLKIILENATNSSLILIDEMGSGTDPIEGSSLAAAVLERLSKIGPLTIVTTHHGSLKSFAFETPGMENAAMEFDSETLKPTYRFRLGVPGSSYAIEMAERLQLPIQVIQRSREIKGDDATKIEHLILDLERKTQDLKFSLDNLKEEKLKLASLNSVYQHKIASLETEIKNIKAHALDEAKSIVRGANTIIEKTIREIRQTAADRQVIKKGKDEIKKVVCDFEKMLQDIDTSSVPVDTLISVGDHVRLKQSNMIGEVVSVSENNHFIIILGDVKIKAHQSDIGSKVELQSKPSAIPSKANISDNLVQREIDLRGMYGDEAINAVDKFLDQSILAGLHRIDIIHGKGTGVLRKKISEYLRAHTSIKSFRLGEWNEGGAGVTVVELE